MSRTRAVDVNIHAVDPVSDSKASWVPLEMDIRGPGVQSLQQEEVHELHHRSFVSQHDQVVQGGVHLPTGQHTLFEPGHDPLGRKVVG